MKRLFVLVVALVLLLPGVGTAFAGVDWDGDPLFDVGGTKVHVAYSIGGGGFVRDGGQVTIVGTAPDARLLGKGPRYVHASAVQAGEAGKFGVTTTLSGPNVPSSFELRFRIPAEKVDLVVTVTNGQTVWFDVP